MTQAAILAASGSPGTTTGFKNKLINGNMVIDQRNAGVSITPTVDGIYSLDRWITRLTQASKYSVQQVSDAPDGFINSLKVTSLSAYSVNSTDFFQVGQYVEGLNAYDLMWGTSTAKTVTLSFWVKSSLTGTFGGTVFGYVNGAPSYPFSYTISAANTWTQISVTIPGPTTGTFQTNNSGCFTVLFSFGVGSSISGPANTWYSGLYRAPTGSTSVVGTNGATWQVTGCQLEVGTTATNFDFRSQGTELALCQRYFSTIGKDSTNSFILGGYGLAGAAGYACYTNPVTMRTNPTVTNVGTFYVANCGQPTVTGTAGATSIGLATTVTSTSGFVVASSPTYYFTVSAEL